MTEPTTDLKIQAYENEIARLTRVGLELAKEKQGLARQIFLLKEEMYLLKSELQKHGLTAEELNDLHN